MWLCFLQVSCLSWGDPVLESTVSTVGLTSNLPKGLMPTRTSLTAAASAPFPEGGCFQPRPLLSLASAGDPQTLTGRSDTVSCEVTTSFSSVYKILFVLSKSLSFPQSCGNSIIKSCCPSKSVSLGVPFAGSQLASLMWDLEPLWQCENFFRIILQFGGCLPAGMGFDFDMITSFLPSRCSFTFVPGHGISFSFFFFFCEFQYPVSGCSTSCCYFGVLTGEDGHTSFYSAIFHLVVMTISWS